MATYSVPNTEKRILQPNSGDVQGNVFATFNVDLNSNKGRIRTGGNVLKAFTNADDADFAGYAGAIARYAGDIFAISDKAFTTSDDTPTSGWAEASTSGSEPNSGNTVMDAVTFDGLLLVSEATDIKRWNDTSWASWWQTTLSQSALATGERHLIRVGADGNLYIVDSGNKLYKVTPASVVTTTGAGTLDFSSTTHTFQCMETSSTRLWIGTKNSDGEAVVIEWDMAPNSNSANRIHKVGAKAVYCIAIWNDTPIALLSNGRVKYFDGSSFVDFPGAQLPVGEKVLLSEYVHPNGWAIIDNYPHFLLRGGAESGVDAYTSTTSGNWYFPAGVWCLDPEIGLYHRYAIGSGTSTQTDYGHLGVRAVGALYALEGEDTKFLCSYEYYSTTSTTVSVLAYHDSARTKPSTAFLATIPYDSFNDPFKAVKAIHKRLGTNDRINLYYRTHEATPVLLDGAFASTTQFNTTENASAVQAGYHAIIKAGPGAGKWGKISQVQASAFTYTLTFEEAFDFVTANQAAAIEVLNFKKLGTITSQQDWHEFQIPNSEKARRCQVLIEIEQAAGNKPELDWVIINT